MMIGADDDQRLAYIMDKAFMATLPEAGNGPARDRHLLVGASMLYLD